MKGYISNDGEAHCIRYGKLYSYMYLGEYAYDMISLGIAYSIGNWEMYGEGISYADSDCGLLPDGYIKNKELGKALLKKYKILW